MKLSVPTNIPCLVVSRADSDELADWIMQATSGDQLSQLKLYEHLAIKIYRVIRKIVGSSNADDVMQDFVMRLFQKLSQFRFDSSFDTWAYRIAVNQSLQYLRKSAREKQHVRKVASANYPPHKTTITNRTEDAELLTEVMQRISCEQRAILHMKEVDGLGYEAISNILEISVGTVGSRLNNARKVLRDTMIELGWEG